MNDSPNVRLEASSRLRLEIDDVGVIATVLTKDGAPLVSDNNPARYPWAGVRKTTGEPHFIADEPKTELQAIREKSIKRADRMAKLETES